MPPSVGTVGVSRRAEAALSISILQQQRNARYHAPVEGNPAKKAATCPCGASRGDLARCCGPLLNGEQQAKTALQLMRSRYVAFATGDIAYLVLTHHPQTRKEFDRAAAARWAVAATFSGLRIVDVVDGGADDENGIVEFIASFTLNKKKHEQRERSRFARHGRLWRYVDGDIA